ncbi:MAG: hypothetical protein ACREMS_01715 [Gemmatimonadaceae bacterium]
MTKLLLAILFVAPALRAQVVVISNDVPPLPVNTRITNLAINGAIGSVTGLVWASIRHSSKWKGLTQGAAGGLLMSAGRQIAATPFNGSGFLGREVSAVGVSLTASSGEEHTLFVFPIGPMSLEYGERSWDWRLDVADFGALVGLAIASNTSLDLHRTLSSGVPVFRDRRASFGQVEDYTLTAITELGTIRLSQDAFTVLPGTANVIYHENVHILQDDFFEDAIGLPPERQAIEHLPFGRRFLRHLDLGLLGPCLVSGMSGLIPYKPRPWEREAYALTANLYY